jgi:hypothetical protein
MRNMFRAAVATCATLALVGCYVTEKDLITPQNAAYPFAAGTTFTSWSWEKDKNAWEQSGSGKVVRVGDNYRLEPDPEAGQTSDPDDQVVFLLADLGDGYFAAQAREKDGGTILLDVAKVEGDTVYQYVLMCEEEDKALATQGIIDKFADGEFSDTCTVSSLDQLRRAFQAKLARGMKPHGKYVIRR